MYRKLEFDFLGQLSTASETRATKKMCQAKKKIKMDGDDGDGECEEKNVVAN